MKAIGVVRKVDELGRIVIPVELRRNMDIEVKDSLEIYTEDNCIILKKYEPSCIFCGVPDFNFIEKQWTERQDEFEKTVVAMHGRPGSDVFNNNVSKVFQRYITQYPGLQFCINAHDHRSTADDLFEDGIIYYGSDCMKRRSYLLFTITPDNYTYEVVYF